MRATGGTASYAANTKTFTVIGAGDDLFGALDAFHFVYEPLIGDGSVTVRVLTDTANDGHSLAGLDIRASLSPSAPDLFLAARDDGSVFVNARPDNGFGGVNLTVQSGALGEFLRIKRIGTAVTASVSSDGVTFTQIAQGTIVLPHVALVGIAVASQTAPTTLAGATFDRFAVSGTASLDQHNLQADLKTLSTDLTAGAQSAAADAKVLLADLSRIKASTSDKVLRGTLVKDENTHFGKLKNEVRLFSAALTKDTSAIISDSRRVAANPGSVAAQSKLNAAIAMLQTDNAGGQSIVADAASADAAFQTDLNALAAANSADSQTETDLGTASADSAGRPGILATDLGALNRTDATTEADFAG